MDLPPRSHIGVSHLRKTNWLPVSERVEFCITTTVFKYRTSLYHHILMICLSYINYMIHNSSGDKYNTRSQMKLNIPLIKTNKGQQVLSFPGPKIWAKTKYSTKNLVTTILY